MYTYAPITFAMITTPLCLHSYIPIKPITSTHIHKNTFSQPHIYDYYTPLHTSTQVYMFIHLPLLHMYSCMRVDSYSCTPIHQHHLATTFLSHHIPIPPHPYPTTSLSHHIPIPTHPYPTTSLSHHIPIPPHPYPTTLPSHHIPIPPHSHPTTSLSHYIPIPPYPYPTTSLYHHTPIPLYRQTTSPHIDTHQPIKHFSIETMP